MPVDCQMCCSLSLSPTKYLSLSLSLPYSPPLCLYVSVQKKDFPLDAVKCTNQMEEAYKENMVEKMFCFFLVIFQVFFFIFTDLQI